MKYLISFEVVKEFLGVGKEILSNQFIFDENEVEEFAKKYVANVNAEHTELYVNGSHGFKVLMWTDYEARQIFSCNFAGLHLLRTLKDYYGFSIKEISLFEELLSKYISEVVEIIEPPEKYERANY